MHDKNGKRLNVGDQIHTFTHDGLLTITEFATQTTGNGWTDYLYAKDAIGDHGVAYPQDRCSAEVQKVRSWKELAQEALDVQNASNLSGVSNSFASVVREVRTRLESEGKVGNAAFHTHAVIQLWADKIASLTGTQGDWTASPAYNWAHEQSKK